MLALDFSANLLTCIQEKWLPESVNLEVIRLNQNRIMYVANNSFSHMTKLRYLHLRDNKISSVSADTFPTQSLVTVDLKENPLCHKDVKLLNLSSTRVLLSQDSNSPACNVDDDLSMKGIQMCSGGSGDKWPMFTLAIIIFLEV